MSGGHPVDHRRQRALGVAGIAWGSALLTVGPGIWRSLDERVPTGADRVALRFLGARHVATGVTQVVLPNRFQPLEIGVDLIHTATMLALAALDPPRRRPALVTAAVASASAVAGMRIRARTSPPTWSAP